MPDLAASLELLTSPAILFFFFLGAAAAFVRSDLAITFPFNLTLGIALHAAAAHWLWS